MGLWEAESVTSAGSVDAVEEWDQDQDSDQDSDRNEDHVAKPVTHLGKLEVIAHKHGVNPTELYNLFSFFSPEPVTINSRGDISINCVCNLAVLENLLTHIPWAGVAATYLFALGGGDQGVGGDQSVTTNIVTVRIAQGHRCAKSLLKGGESKPALRLASKLTLNQVKASVPDSDQFLIVPYYCRVEQQWFQIVWTQLDRNLWAEDSTQLLLSDSWGTYYSEYQWLDELSQVCDQD